MKNIVVSGSFDNMRSGDVRFLEEAARLGDLHVELWPDATVERLSGCAPRFPQAERLYFLQALRYVHSARLAGETTDPDRLACLPELRPHAWVVLQNEASPQRQAYCQANGLKLVALGPQDLAGFPRRHYDALEPLAGPVKVVVTGCYDWLHSGHVRFFEEVSGYGNLYVVVGNDANLRQLKGEGHPLFSQEERRYLVQSVRHVRQALIATGSGWMDAAPQIEALQPQVYAVNEDGDRPEKRQFCREHGLQYLVLKRTPRPGLPRRESTVLRGF
jgi:cytidyltransferase-like protein